MRIAGWSFGNPKRGSTCCQDCDRRMQPWLMLPGSSDAVQPQSSDSAGPADDSPALAPSASTRSRNCVAGRDAKSPLDGLKIASQSWRRGGLGSKELVTLTLRNANDYAVKDIEIACAFARRDGSHLTDRRRVIPDTVNMKSRKRYAGMLVGFVNVNANKAKCSLATASRL